MIGIVGRYPDTRVGDPQHDPLQVAPQRHPQLVAVAG
jgi:hypothetical protein